MSQVGAALLVVTGALIGGAVGAGLTLAITSPNSATPQGAGERPRPLPSVQRTEKVPAGESLETLRARIDSLNRRVSLLTFAQDHASPVRAGTGDADAGGEEGAKEAVDNPVFEAAVRDVMDQVEYERDAERDAQRTERRGEWTKRWTASLREKLSLRPDQDEKIQAIVREHFEAMRAMRDSDGGTGPVLRSEWRARIKEVSDRTEQNLGALFDSSQKAKYDAIEESDKLGGRGAWGR